MSLGGSSYLSFILTCKGITAYVIAKQLTWREIDLFKKITPREFLDQNWQNEDKGSSSPNLTENIEKFNEVSKVLYKPKISQLTKTKTGELLGMYRYTVRALFSGSGLAHPQIHKGGTQVLPLE